MVPQFLKAGILKKINCGQTALLWRMTAMQLHMPRLWRVDEAVAHLTSDHISGTAIPTVREAATHLSALLHSFSGCSSRAVTLSISRLSA